MEELTHQSPNTYLEVISMNHTYCIYKFIQTNRIDKTNTEVLLCNPKASVTPYWLSWWGVFIFIFQSISK
ncbi:hypothetical protein A7309_09340 [Paenibacillus polymyxa]|nr:hypothetical protein PPYC2_23210 [Paenibacillus polymyxa]ODB64627.1 hypothetical protein A7309_09340 [Paenibacillus polymyxa]OME67476.1 hypothetical protein BK119_19490 [Paenibacillus peoriae]POR28068.1 hypothetical protein CG775_09945 [Paenibacillus polymyxa]